MKTVGKLVKFVPTESLSVINKQYYVIGSYVYVTPDDFKSGYRRTQILKEILNQ